MSKQNRKPVVISYIRFSTPEQAKGNSLRRQMENAEKWAAERGLTIDSSLRDEGVSAYKGKNAKQGSLSTFLQLVKDGKVPAGSTLIVESIDRISRDEILTALNLFTSIIQAGVRVVTLSDNREYTAEKINQNPLDLMASLLVMQRANEESRIKSDRLADAWADRRKQAVKEGQAISGRCPQWLRVENGKYITILDRVAVVKRIFKMAREGWGIERIASTLTADGVQPFSDKKNKNVRKVWLGSYVSKILHNRAVLGEYQPMSKRNGGKREPVGEPLANYYPRVITDAEFYKVAASIKSRYLGGGGRGDFVPLLRARIFDASGTPMQIMDKGYGRQYRADHTGGLPRKSTSGFPVSIMDEAVLETICSAEWFPKQESPANDENAARHGRIGEIDTRLAKIADLMASGGNIETLATAAQKLEAEKKALKIAIASTQQTVAVTDELSEWLDAAKLSQSLKGNEVERRKVAAIVSKAVKRIQVVCRREGKNYIADAVVTLSNGQTVKAEWHAVNVTPPIKRNALGHPIKQNGKVNQPKYRLSIE